MLTGGAYLHEVVVQRCRVVREATVNTLSLEEKVKFFANISEIGESQEAGFVSERVRVNLHEM